MYTGRGANSKRRVNKGVFMSRRSSITSFHTRRKVVQSRPKNFHSHCILVPPRRNVRRPRYHDRCKGGALFPISNSNVHSHHRRSSNHNSGTRVHCTLVVGPKKGPYPSGRVTTSRARNRPTQRSKTKGLMSPRGARTRRRRNYHRGTNKGRGNIPFPTYHHHYRRSMGGNRRTHRGFPNNDFDGTQDKKNTKKEI